jgi:hypothetical protein
MRIIQMRAAVVAFASVLAIGACAKKETPAETQADVAAAQRAGAEQVAEARADAGETMADANKDVAAAARESAHQAAGATRSVALAEAESAHAVAIERCQAEVGDARKRCKDLADARLAEARAAADVSKAASDPKP